MGWSSIGVYSTIGGTLIPSADFNVIVKRDYTTLRNGVHVSDRYCGVSSPAICAGSVGTLVMDKTVRMKSDNNFDYGETKNVIICEDSFTDEFVMKIDSDINVINISMEVLYDNMNLVSDVKTIDDLIESNNTTINPPDDTTSDNTDEETSNDTPSNSNDVIPPSDDISNEENSSEQPEQDKGNTDNDPNDIVDTTTEEKPDISEDVTPDDNK